MKKRTRLTALLMCVCLLLSFAALPALAADGGGMGAGGGDMGGGGGGDMGAAESNVPTGNQVEGNWVYECTQVSSPTGDMTMDDFMQMMMAGTLPINSGILWGAGEETQGNVVMIPGNLGGYDVTTIGNGAQNISSNNKNNDVYVLIPEGVTTLAGRMIYDYNSTSGWSIPSTVTSISTDPASFLSCAGTFYGESGSAAETYANSDSTRDFVTYSEDGSKTFTVSDATEETNEDGTPVGYIQPNGTYNLPSGMLDGKHSITFHIVSDYQYKIATLTVDGKEVSEAVGQNEYDLDYTFTTSSSDITVTFEADPSDSRNPDELVESYDYQAPEILDAAVAEGATLPDNVNDYLGVNTGATAKYTNTMGISTGLIYVADGKTYKMIDSYQSTEEPDYMSLAEAINGVYKSHGKVYGDDYDLIRVYNYYENQTSGPSQGVCQLYCTYLYKEVDPATLPSENYVDNTNINTASVFVQAGGDLTLDNFTSRCYTSSKGPSEAGNFFGMGSAIHVDGGDATTPADTIIYKSTSKLTLNNPQILGTNNSIYATASGVIDINGGNIFSCSSGGHGPYVSTGGEITLNTDGTDLIAEDGSINRDASKLTATERPSADLGTMSRDDDDNMVGVYQEHDDDVTVVVTGDEAGTALATDSGGGVIVANQVVTKTFGLRCAGVYSIGYDESWVYCFNSTLTSYLDAGLCSASGGYIYAYNCDINGVMGMKARSGGNSESEETGIYVTNSRVAAYFDADEMANAYDVADPDTMQALMDSGEIDVDSIGTGYSKLNMFIDKANSPKFYEDSLKWWFVDKSKTPGYSGGNKFAVMYVENSSTPMYVTASKMVNQNYVEYGDASKLDADATPADNLLLSVEGAGSASVYFTDENDQTKWDLTGESDDTTELVGDFFLGAYSSAAGDPNIGTGANTANLYFDNSQWEGTVLYGEEENPTGICNLSFDQDSSWKVTADTTVADLEIYNVENITADKPVTVTFTSTDTVVAGTYGNVTLEGPGVDEWPEITEEPEEEPEEAPAEESSALEEASAAEETTVAAAAPAASEAPVEEAPAAEAEEAPAETEEASAETSNGVSGGAVAGILAAVVVVGGGIGFGVSRKKKKQ